MTIGFETIRVGEYKYIIILCLKLAIFIGINYYAKTKKKNEEKFRFTETLKEDFLKTTGHTLWQAKNLKNFSLKH